MTLPELMMVCTIVGVVAAIALPRIDTVRPQADAAAALVRATLQQAQRAAIQRQYDVVVSVDVPNRRLRIFPDSTNDGVIASQDPVRWVPLDPGAAFAVPPRAVPGGLGTAALAGAGVRTVAGLPSVTFHRGGSASTDATIYVAVTGRGGRTERRAVTVVRGTGATTAWREAAGAWQQGEL